MNRRVFLLGLPGLAGCTSGRGLRLNVLNWSNYVAPGTIPRFEQETGMRVRYATYESNEELLARVMSGNSGWDVVFPSNYFIRPMVEQGLVSPLERARLPGRKNLEPRFQSPPWDPELRWSVPYMWGASGIVFNRSMTPPVASWADLWDARVTGRLTMLDDPAEVLGACLKKLGLGLNSTDTGELRRAQREAIRQKPLVRAYVNAEVRDQVVAGDVLAAQLWATTAQQAMDASPELRFVYPAEGFALYCDTVVILRESRRKDLAHRFIEYLLRPEVAAEIVAHTRTATANAVSAGSRNPVLYPPAEVLARGEWFAALPPAAQRLRDRLWTEIKSA